MSTFPSYVSVLLAGFGEARESGVQRTQMEVGPPKMLKTKSRVLVSRDCTLRVGSKADYLSFLTWFETTINMGADWFTWTDPVSGTSKSARIAELGTAKPEVYLPDGWRIPARIETWSA